MYGLSTTFFLFFKFYPQTYPQTYSHVFHTWNINYGRHSKNVSTVSRSALGKFYTSATVSLAIASSSLVGITRTFTLESLVVMMFSKPRFAFSSSSKVIPRYPK